VSPSPIVHLYQSAGIGLIVPAPTGIRYSNQTAGTYCEHPVVEGFYVPLRNESEEGAFDGPRSREFKSPEHALVEYFCGRKYEGTGATHGIDDEDADAIEAILAGYFLDEVLRVDRSRMAESTEAWIYVVVLKDDHVFDGCGPYPRRAVLTWKNSD